MPELEAHLAPLPLNELTLPVVLELPELKARPGLVAPLLPRVRALPELSHAAVLRAAQLALAVPDGPLLAGDLVDLVEGALVGRHRSEGRLEPSDLTLALALGPSRALAILRATRDAGERRWVDASTRERLETAALAHEIARQV